MRIMHGWEGNSREMKTAARMIHDSLAPIAIKRYRSRSLVSTNIFRRKMKKLAGPNKTISLPVIFTKKEIHQRSRKLNGTRIETLNK